VSDNFNVTFTLEPNFHPFILSKIPGGYESDKSGWVLEEGKIIGRLFKALEIRITGPKLKTIDFTNF
jgi:hypothetical protein